MTLREILDNAQYDTLEEGKLKKALAVALMAISLGASAFAGNSHDLNAAKQALNYNQTYSKFDSTDLPSNIQSGKSKTEIYTSYNYEVGRPKVTIFLRCFKEDLKGSGTDIAFDNWIKSLISDFKGKLSTLLNNISKFDYSDIANNKPTDNKVDIEIKLYSDFDVKSANYYPESLEYCRDVVKSEFEKYNIPVGTVKIRLAKTLTDSHGYVNGTHNSEYYDKERLQKVYDDYKIAQEKEKEREEKKFGDKLSKTLDVLTKITQKR